MYHLCLSDIKLNKVTLKISRIYLLFLFFFSIECAFTITVCHTDPTNFTKQNNLMSHFALVLCLTIFHVNCFTDYIFLDNTFSYSPDGTKYRNSQSFMSILPMRVYFRVSLTLYCEKVI